MLHKTVIVLSKPECGASMHAAGSFSRMVASRRTKEAGLRLEFVSMPSRFVDETNFAMVSGGQEKRHNRLRLDLEG